jgi:hypothetical protein
VVETLALDTGAVVVVEIVELVIVGTAIVGVATEKEAALVVGATAGEDNLDSCSAAVRTDGGPFDSSSMSRLAAWLWSL